MNMHSFRRRSRRGFTLIELIIVIVILAMMAGVSYPVYMSYLNKSKITVCLANLKELHGLGLAYSQDHAGVLPCSGMADDPRTKNLDESQGWWVALVPYAYPSSEEQPLSRRDPVTLPKSFTCPSDTRLDEYGGEVQDASPETVSYTSWTDNSAAKRNPKSPIQITRGQQLSGLPWLTDGIPYRDSSVRTEDDFNERVLPDSEYDRHGGGVSVLYADGATKHVQDATFKSVAPALANQY